MTLPVFEGTMGSVYLNLLAKILMEGQNVHIGRTNQLTREVVGLQIVLTNPLHNIFEHPVRNLNYRFMLAEWLWILAGRDDLSMLTKYNSKMAQFSDNGVTLAGAYGPRLFSQWYYLLSTLTKDPSSRQAVATIWTPSPAASKDIPCTIACQFLIRDNCVHGIFTMRSSDAWLGIPYDCFTFAQMVNSMAGELGREVGSLILNLGSSHLYESNFKDALELVRCKQEMRYFASPCLPGFPGSNEIWKNYLSAMESADSKTCLKALIEMEQRLWKKKQEALHVAKA